MNQLEKEKSKITSKMESFLRKHMSHCKKLVGMRAEAKFEHDLVFSISGNQ